MITREKLSRCEGEIVEGDPKIGSRKRTSQSEKMASEEGLSQNEREFQRTFFTMSDMVKVLHGDYLEQKRPVQGEYSKQAKSEEGEEPPKTPHSPPSSPSSSSSSSTILNTTSSRKHSHKHKPDMPLLKLDVKFVFPMYDAKLMLRNLITRLDRWRYIVMCSKLKMRQPKDWHRLILK
jgi:hypothetical protein